MMIEDTPASLAQPIKIDRLLKNSRKWSVLAGKHGTTRAWAGEPFTSLANVACTACRAYREQKRKEGLLERTDHFDVQVDSWNKILRIHEGSKADPLTAFVYSSTHEARETEPLRLALTFACSATRENLRRNQELQGLVRISKNSYP